LAFVHGFWLLYPKRLQQLERVSEQIQQ